MNSIPLLKSIAILLSEVLLPCATTSATIVRWNHKDYETAELVLRATFPREQILPYYRTNILKWMQQKKKKKKKDEFSV